MSELEGDKIKKVFLFFCDSNLGGRELVHNHRPTSVTRFGKMSPLRQKVENFGNF